MFADFERATHSYAEAGGVLTPDYLCKLWGDLNAQYYGPELVIDPASLTVNVGDQATAQATVTGATGSYTFAIDPADGIARFDAETGAITVDATGFDAGEYTYTVTAANAFASSILANEDRAVERYLKFLQSGGSDYSLNILRRAGVDLTSEEPFERTMKFFEERLNAWTK